MIAGLSPEIRFVQVTTMAERYDKLLEPWRLGATMFAVFGGLALIVAIVGLYAVLAFAVAQRRRELVIRSALGARDTDLIWLVMRQAGAFVAAGLLIGTALAAAAGRFVEGLLFNVQCPRSVRLRRRDARSRASPASPQASAPRGARPRSIPRRHSRRSSRISRISRSRRRRRQRNPNEFTSE